MLAKLIAAATPSPALAALLLWPAGCSSPPPAAAESDPIDVVAYEAELAGVPYEPSRPSPAPSEPAPKPAPAPEAAPSAAVSTASATAPAPRAAQPAEPAPAGSDLAGRFVLDPAAARTLGYRIDWQIDTFPSQDSGIRRLAVQHDSIFVLDGQNFLSRFRRDDGERLWRLPVAEPVQEILGITFVPALERVYLTMGGSLLVLDAASGSPVGRQRLEKIANTEPVVFGAYLLYGSRSGQLVWHAHEIAFRWREHQIGPSIQLTPVLQGHTIVTVGSDGRVAALDASAAHLLWSKQVLDRVVAAPAFGDEVVFVAATDQYLYAIDLASGRTIWRRFMATALTDSPVVLGDRVYQHVPGEGLACFEALPLNAFDGRLVWLSRGTSGNVLLRRRGELLLWDPRTRRLTIVDENGGAVKRTADLPRADHLLTTALQEGDLFAASNDGRLLRLVP